MKKLLLITENWAPRVGGIENYLLAVAEELGKEHQIEVVAPETVNFRNQNKGGVAVTRYSFYSRWRRPKWSGLYQRILRRVQEEQVGLILCGKALFDGLLALRIKKKTGVGYVVFTYGMEIEEWIGKRKTRRRLARVLKEADLVVYINEETKARLKELGVPEEKLLEVLPGVRERFTRELAEEVKLGTVRHYGLQQPFVLSVGRLVPRKGFDVLIEAFAKLDQVKFGDWRLVIVGDGPLKEELKELADDNFAGKSVRFLTNVPDRHLPAIYQAAEFFALTPKDLPGDKEGFGMVYAEAAAAGKACLGTKTGGVVQAVLENETGVLAQPNNVEAVWEDLERLITDEKLRVNLGARGRELARREWSWEKRLQGLRKWIKTRLV